MREWINVDIKYPEVGKEVLTYDTYKDILHSIFNNVGKWVHAWDGEHLEEDT